MTVQTLFQKQREVLNIFAEVLECQTKSKIEIVKIVPDKYVLTNYRAYIKVLVTEDSTISARDIAASLDMKLLLWQELHCTNGDPFLIPYLFES